MRAAACLFLIVRASCAVADQPPLLAAAPSFCAWTIDVQQWHPRQPAPSDPKQAATYQRIMEASPRMVRVSVEKAGENYHRETTFENDRTDTLWIYKGWVLFRPTNFPPNQIMAMRAKSRLSPVKNGVGLDFPDLSWLQGNAFVRTVTYRGQRCDYFEDRSAAALVGGDALDPAPVRVVHAWIDSKSRLPVAVEDDAVLKTFHFLNDPPDQLQPIGAFAEAYQNAQGKPGAAEAATDSPMGNE